MGTAKAINDAAMRLYSGSDLINRSIAYNAGHIMAEDLIKGVPGALKALKNMGKGSMAGLKSQGIKDAIESGDAKKVGDILGKQLVSLTQFHYGPEQRSQFAREMGPMFSMFSKWPSTIGSKIVDIWKENPKMRHKAQKYFERYGAQWIVLAAMKSAMEDEDSPMLNYLIGDPTQLSPTSALQFSYLNTPALGLLNATSDVVKKSLGGEPPNVA